MANLLDQVGASFAIIRSRPDLIWCNTVLSACYIRPGVALNRAVVLHAHEPGERISQVLARYDLDEAWPNTTLVGCAPRVCDDLAASTGVTRGDIVCIPSVPDAERILNLARQTGPALPLHGVLVGACGTANATKGVDLWLDVVTRVVNAVPELRPHFVWIGEAPGEDLYKEADRSNVAGHVTFTGQLANPYPLLRSLDVFLLTSRADPFPLVILEAMILGRPVVSFDVGDVGYQIGEDRRLIPVGAVEKMTREVVELLRDPEERARSGAAGVLRVQEHFRIERFRVAVQQLAERSIAVRQSRRSAQPPMPSEMR